MDLSFSVGFVSPATGRRGFGGAAGRQGWARRRMRGMIRLASEGVNRLSEGLPTELLAAPGVPPTERVG
jgi:hypothetical protein